MCFCLLTWEGVRFIMEADVHHQGEETVVLENHDLVIAVQVLLLPFRPELGPSPGLFAVSGFTRWQ